MDNIANLQSYWWLIIAVLGAALVFLLFVQGGQSMLFCRNTPVQKQLMVNSLGRKWEFTFTTLVVFGGAFFASFPLFYSTSFGGAYWLWMLILLSFVVQAFSYEFRRKKGNLYGTGFYDFLLLFNAVVGCVLLGVAVGLFFIGADFTVGYANITDPANPVISTWAPTRGLEAITCWKNLLLGFTVFFLARTLGGLYFINNINDGEEFDKQMRFRVLVSGGIFAVLFVAFVIVLLLQGGYRYNGTAFVAENNIYLHNLLDMWYLGVIFLIGTVSVLVGIFGTFFKAGWRDGIWFAGLGTAAVIVVLFLIAGYGGTAYLPSNLDPQSSLSIVNSSSSLFTLRTMTYVSFLVPIVLSYIAYVWSRMNATQLTETELNDEPHQY